MYRWIQTAIIMLVVFILCNCTRPEEDFQVSVTFSSELSPKSIQWWLDPWDESEIRYKWSSQDVLLMTKQGKATKPIIQVKPENEYQDVLGFGSSLEDTTVHAILKNKSNEEAKDVLRSLIDPKSGLGLNLWRVTIGTSDFSDGRSVAPHPKGFYSYQDDMNSEFSIENDRELGILKVVKMAREVGRESGNELTIFASAWSPPAWMKTSNALIGGTLKEGYEDELARYLVKFIKAYEAEGIPIYALTVQNEPNFLPNNYPGMLLSMEQERDVAAALKDELVKNNLKTKIWINDHNYDTWGKARDILWSLDEMGQKKVVDGVAFHHYAGSVSNLSKLKEIFPAMNIHFSEGSKWGTKGADEIAILFRNYSSSYVAWVTMSTQELDEHNQGPYNVLGKFTPTYLIQKKGNSKEWIKTADYYLLGQFSRHVKPGAKRIYSSYGNLRTVTTVAFRNPDNTLVLIAVNQGREVQEFTIQCHDYQIAAAIPEKTVATYVWDSTIKKSGLEVMNPPFYETLQKGPVLASAIIEAEEFDKMKGVQIEGNGIGYFDGGDWIAYSKVNFGDGGYSAIRFYLAVDTSYAGKKIEIHLDGENGKLLGTHTVQSTGGWFNYSEQSSSINGTDLKGIHTLYIKGAGGDGIANIDYFLFE
ncbi:MAG: carbohydrate-binding protein [Spirochaetes bacterium]|jgi:glucosylceramidase|nr:carbohydrate-binding protein [Spirochaetota bacterium]